MREHIFHSLIANELFSLLTYYHTVVSLVVSCFSQCDVLMNLHWGCGIKMTNRLGLFLLGLHPMELVSHWLCQFWQSLPVSAESAGFGRFCRFRRYCRFWQILPILADTADCTWELIRFLHDTAYFGRLCQFRQNLPILADSANFGQIC